MLPVSPLSLLYLLLYSTHSVVSGEEDSPSSSDRPPGLHLISLLAALAGPEHKQSNGAAIASADVLPTSPDKDQQQHAPLQHIMELQLKRAMGGCRGEGRGGEGRSAKKRRVNDCDA